MEDYLNQNIKEILNKFPRVTDVLNDYNIGCVPCQVGSCRLKDIVDIHNLPPEDERALMSRIAAIIDPGQKMIIPLVAIKSGPAVKQTGYSPPMKKLVDEHTLIKRLLALVSGLVDSLDLETEAGRQVVLDSVDFIRSYADKYHHAKEEDILFGYFDENQDIIKTMRLDHETGRAHVRSIVLALDENNKEAIRKHLNGYRELLTEHIGKEDGILFPWMDRNLTIKQVGELFARFNEKDRDFGNLRGKYETLVSELEEQINLKGVIK
jgi:hemerythrin-like domain-containing protein